MKYSRNVREAASETAPAMPHDPITRLKLSAAAEACFISIDTAERLVKRRLVPFTRSGRLRFVAVGDLLAAARR